MSDEIVLVEQIESTWCLLPVMSDTRLGKWRVTPVLLIANPAFPTKTRFRMTKVHSDCRWGCKFIEFVYVCFDDTKKILARFWLDMEGNYKYQFTDNEYQFTDQPWVEGSLFESKLC
jgi:hypothetical protein